jgi:hypothetical protein
MSRYELPRTATASRLQALFAAAIVTLATLSGIDALAVSEGATLVAAIPTTEARG